MPPTEKTLVAVQEQEIINEQGECKSLRRAATYKVQSEPSFVKLYTSDVATLNGIRGVPKDVLVLMAGKMDYENVVVVSPDCRKRWVAELGVSMSTLNNSISYLLKSGHIVNTGGKRGGEYRIDPLMFAKGAWKEIILKQEDFKAEFEVTYKKTNGGYERRFIKANVKPDNMKIDYETGKIAYTRRGKPVEP